MNIIVHNLEIKNSDEVKKYYSEILKQHFKKIFKRKNVHIAAYVITKLRCI